MASLRDAPLQLIVAGAGGETARWQALAWKLRISEKIRWLGHLPRMDAIAAIRDADVFVLSSVQEGTPNVISEALSAGLPIICHDAFGMRYFIDDSCGIKVPMSDFRQSVEGFAAAIRKCVQEPGLVNRLSHGALARARHLSWDAKARQIADVYDRICNSLAVRR